MNLGSYYPVIGTTDVAGTVAFYRRHLPLVPAFDSGGYVHLVWRPTPGEPRRPRWSPDPGGHERVELLFAERPPAPLRAGQSGRGGRPGGRVAFRGLEETFRDLPAGHLFVIQEGKGIIERRRLG
jgi:catechol 2,3-dioxygenase-like lactoylglutathione lyase family enzyme